MTYATHSRLSLALALGCLMTFTGCSTQTAVQSKVSVLTPPANLYPHCEQVVTDDMTYGGAIELIPQLRAEIDKCNAQSDTLKLWIEQAKAEAEK